MDAIFKNAFKGSIKVNKNYPVINKLKKDTPDEFSIEKTKQLSTDPVSAKTTLAQAESLDISKAHIASLETISDEEYTLRQRDFEASKFGYSYVYTPHEFLGLIPYCGGDDISKDINCWLSGRFSKNRKGIDLKKAVENLDYSLKKLDEKYGVHNGYVYRVGYFAPGDTRQFYSSAKTPEKAYDFYRFSIPCETRPFNIIKVNNGHKIMDFQLSFDDDTLAYNFGKAEEEILIDRKCFFKDTTNTKEGKKIRKEILARLYSHLYMKKDFDTLSEKEKKEAIQKSKSLEKICMPYIRVYEQIS